MIPELRQQFNRNWAPEKYRNFRKTLEQRLGCPVEIAISETPCFFPRELMDRLARAGRELTGQLLSNPRYLSDSRSVVPPQFDVPHDVGHPLFVCADFGLVRGEWGQWEPRLVEIQGFPSLYAFHPVFARQYIESYQLDPGLEYLLGGMTDAHYRDLLGRAITGRHDPENVILMEIDPLHQKTYFDFAATEKIFGVRPVCITQLVKQGNKLFYRCAGRLVPVHRIYNRVIIEELVRRNIQAPFDWREELDVEWAGHPNWFFRISKFSLPYLRHPAAPYTVFLDRVPELPHDLDNWVLKPLFSFAGAGVLVGPTREQVEAIPHGERGGYILQQRVRFDPAIDTPHGPTQAEIRVMYVWLDEMTPMTTIVRMGRGKMMGVDHNKGLSWVGGSAALLPKE